MAGETEFLGAQLKSLMPSMDLYVLGLLAFCIFFVTALVGGLLFLSMYKHKVILWPVTGPGGARGRIREVKCRRYIDDKGNHFWASLFNKDFGMQPAPDDDFICNGKGKGDVACGFLLKGNMVYCRPDVHEKYVKETPVLDTRGKPVYEEVDGETKPKMQNSFWAQLDLFTGVQRWAYQDALKAAAKKKASWEKWAFPIIGMGFCVTCLLIMLIYFDTASDLPIKSQELANQGIGRLGEITDKQAEIMGLLVTTLERDQIELQATNQSLPPDPPR